MRRRSSDRSTRSRLARAALLACGIALASIGSACGSGEEPADPGARGHPDRARSGVRPRPPAAAMPGTRRRIGDRRAIATEGVIPEGFPSDIPVYPGARSGLR